jgi:hypothetical protein
MNNSLEIYINGELIDYSDSNDFPLRLYRKAIDFKDPASRKGETTYTIKLPNTLNNQRIFGSLQQLDEIFKFRRGQVWNCIVNNGSQTVIRGIFYMTGVNETELEGYITAHNGEIGGLLDGKSLRDLTGLEYEFTCWESMRENIANQITNLDTHFRSLVCYPLVSYGKYFIANIWGEGNVIPASYYGAPSFGNINIAPKLIFGVDEYSLTDNSNTYLYFQDVPPSHYIKPILERIFFDAGFTVAGSWIEKQETKRLVMPYVGERDVIYNWELIGKAQANGGANYVGAILFFQNYDFPGTNYNSFFDNIPTTGNEPRYYDATNQINNALYPTGSSQPLLTHYYTWFNLLRFPNNLQDLVFSLNTSTVLDQDSEPIYTLFTCPTDGVYTFDVELQVDLFADSPPYPASIDYGSIFKKAWGISVISGTIPNDLDNNRTIDLTNPLNSTVKFTDFILFTGTINEIVELELKKNDKICIWISCIMPCAPDGTMITNSQITYATLPLWAQGQCNDFGGNARGDFYLPNFMEASVTNVTINVKDLTETPERDRFGTLMRVPNNLPDVKQIDFLKSFINLYNLYLEVDTVNKVVWIESINDFYQPNILAYDITEKTNKTTFNIKPPDVPKSYNFKWKVDSGDFATIIKGSNYDVIYQTLVTGAQSEVVIDSGIFASTEFESFTVVQSNTVLSPFINPSYQNLYQVSLPRMVSKDRYYEPPNTAGSAGFGYEPRLLYVRDFSVMGSMPITQRDDAGVRLYEQLPAFINLAFANPLSYQNLYVLYYRDFYFNVSNGYECDCDVKINAYDYSQMRINVPIFYNGVIYFLKSINGFNPVNQTITKITLFKI